MLTMGCISPGYDLGCVGIYKQKMDFKDKLRRLRNAKGATQNDIASILGIKLSRYASYEEGRSRPNYETLLSICRYYSVTVESIIDNNSDIVLKLKVKI